MSVPSTLASPVFITGYPSLVVGRLVRNLVAAGVETHVLVKDDFEDRARADFEGLSPDLLHLYAGDVVNMDLGLSGAEARVVMDKVRTIFHLAGVYHLGVSERGMMLVNLEGTRNALAFARRCKRLERLVHMSTAFVAGTREGVIMEDELDEGQTFRTKYEESKFLAEKLVLRAGEDIPITIARPSLIVGDSRTGEIDTLEGPHFFMYVLVNLPMNVQLPLPGHGRHPLNLIPIDFLVEVLPVIAADPDAAGLTFHLTDPNPVSARKVFEMVAELAHRKPPRGVLPPSLAAALARMPGLKSSWRSPALLVDIFQRLVLFNARNTTRILTPHGIACAAFPEYAARLVKYMQEHKLTSGRLAGV
ncbi:MAG: SDR family oxidoreductase [Pseudomonadota bacterium]